MYVHSEYNVPQADIKIPDDVGRMAELSEEQHTNLLDYLVSRLKHGNAHFRNHRLQRYARIDKMISTWQKLSKEDSEREREEDITGKSQAITMNLPLLASHLEDSVSFFAEVFAPQRRDFYVTAGVENSQSGKVLADKMNRDTKARKYYSAVCSTLRSLLKYNVGGFAIRFESGGGVGELAEPGNRFEPVDMYNFLYDPSVLDIEKVSSEAEWSARISLKNRLWLERRALRGELQRVGKLIPRNKEGDGGYSLKNSKKEAAFYKRPPSYSGLSLDGQDQQTVENPSEQVDWDAFGATLSVDHLQEIEGYEVTEMYCWLNPNQFGLEESPQEADPPDQYSLWRFIVVDACEVCFAERVNGEEIPHYMCHMTQDDMREAQRSVMELLRPFQRFCSFLMNIYVAGARKNVWGIKGVDPQMFDTSGLEKGDVAGILKSKIPGKDVRTGLLTLDSNPGTDGAFQMMGQTLEIVRTLFPSQALPSQIAGIERAVKNQVAAVLQGVHRRLHMSCRLLDSSLFGPARLQCYRNLAEWDSQGLTGLTEETVSKILGSGLQQLNSDAISQELREVIFAVIQNPDSMQIFDIQKLMTAWSRMMNMPLDLGDVIRQQPQEGAGATAGTQTAESPGVQQ